MVLGHRTYLKAKAVGESSMSGKSRCSESVKRYARQDPGGMVKAGLPEPKSPGVPYHTHRSERLMTMPLPCLSSSLGDTHLLGSGRGPMRTSKGMNWAPTSRYYVLL